MKPCFKPHKSLQVLTLVPVRTLRPRCPTLAEPSSTMAAGKTCDAKRLRLTQPLLRGRVCKRQLLIAHPQMGWIDPPH